LKGGEIVQGIPLMALTTNPAQAQNSVKQIQDSGKCNQVKGSESLMGFANILNKVVNVNSESAEKPPSESSLTDNPNGTIVEQMINQFLILTPLNLEMVNKGVSAESLIQLVTGNTGEVGLSKEMERDITVDSLVQQLISLLQAMGVQVTQSEDSSKLNQAKLPISLILQATQSEQSNLKGLLQDLIKQLDTKSNLPSELFERDITVDSFVQQLISLLQAMGVQVTQSEDSSKLNQAKLLISLILQATQSEQSNLKGLLQDLIKQLDTKSNLPSELVDLKSVLISFLKENQNQPGNEFMAKLAELLTVLGNKIQKNNQTDIGEKDIVRNSGADTNTTTQKTLQVEIKNSDFGQKQDSGNTVKISEKTEKPERPFGEIKSEGVEQKGQNNVTKETPRNFRLAEVSNKNENPVEVEKPEKLGTQVDLIKTKTEISGQGSDSQGGKIVEGLTRITEPAKPVVNNSVVNNNDTQVNLQQNLIREFGKMPEQTTPIPRMVQVIFGQIAEKAKLVVSPGMTEMQIQLKPDILGRLNLSVTTENGLITAKFSAESYQVKAIIETNLNSLRNALAEQGVKVDQLVVNVGTEKDFSEFQQRESGFWKGSQKSGSKIVVNDEGFERMFAKDPKSSAVKAYYGGNVDFTA
jgi:flagellar hook-length control protein FliK